MVAAYNKDLLRKKNKKTVINKVWKIVSVLIFMHDTLCSVT